MKCEINKEILLKNGKTAIIRGVKEGDAPGMLALIKQMCAQTDFLLKTAEEAAQITLADEERWLAGCFSAENKYNLAVEYDGKIVGNAEVYINPHAKTRHRAEVGLGILREYWGLGIGTALMHRLDGLARQLGAEIISLDCIEGNTRALSLYEKCGYKEVAFVPNIICQHGKLYGEHKLQKRL